MNFNLYGEKISLDKYDVEYGIYYRMTGSASEEMVNRFREKLINAKKSINANNYMQILNSMASDFMVVFSGMFDAMWEYVIRVKGNGLNRDSYRQGLEHLWMENVSYLYESSIYPVPHLVFTGISEDTSDDMNTESSNRYIDEAFNWVKNVNDNGIDNVIRNLYALTHDFIGKGAIYLNGRSADILRKHSYDMAHYGEVLNHVGRNVGGNKSLLIKSLAEDAPFEFEAYRLLLEEFGDDEFELEKAASFMELGEMLREEKKAILNEFIRSLKILDDLTQYNATETKYYIGEIENKIGYLGMTDEPVILKNLKRRLKQAPKEPPKFVEEEEPQNALPDSYLNMSRDADTGAPIYSREPVGELKKPPADENEIEQIELKKIRDGIKGKDIVDRYLFYTQYKNDDWKSAKAKKVMERLRISINAEKQRMKERISAMKIFGYLRWIVLLIGVIVTWIMFMNGILVGIFSIAVFGALFMVIFVHLQEADRLKKKLDLLESYENLSSNNDEK